MANFSVFKAIVREQLRKIPRRFRRGVHGFRVERRAKRQPGSLSGLYILGTYHTDADHLGPVVTLYYGSFRRVFPEATLRLVRREVAKTIAHELLHHWELQAGRDLLGDEDRLQLARWRRRMGLAGDTITGRSVLEALTFIYCLLLILAFVAALAN